MPRSRRQLLHNYSHAQTHSHTYTYTCTHTHQLLSSMPQLFQRDNISGQCVAKLQSRPDVERSRVLRPLRRNCFERPCLMCCLPNQKLELPPETLELCSALMVLLCSNILACVALLRDALLRFRFRFASLCFASLRFSLRFELRVEPNQI